MLQVFGMPLFNSVDAMARKLCAVISRRELIAEPALMVFDMGRVECGSKGIRIQPGQ